MELLDNHLTKMAEFLIRHPHIGAIGPKFLNPDLSPQGSVLNRQTPFNALQEYWLGHIGAFTKFTPPTQQPVAVDNISGGAILISRSIFNQIGGWDESYFFYYEDLELCRQIKKIHKQIYFYPAFQVVHRHGFSGKPVIDSANQWRRLIPSSIRYHGIIKHYLLFTITWIPQKYHQVRKWLSL